MRVIGLSASSLLQKSTRLVSVSTKIVHACTGTAANTTIQMPNAVSYPNRTA